MATKYLFAAMKARTDNPVAKLILIYLADAANQDGVCWPAHSTIADNCECSVATVKRQIDALVVKGYISIENKSNKGFKTSNRYHMLEPDLITKEGRPKIAQSEPTIAHSELTDSSERAIEPISNLPTNNTLSKAKAFVRPTVDDVREYSATRPTQIDAEKFHDYYTANGWKVGRNSMKCWQAAVRNWEKTEKRSNQGGSVKPPGNGTRGRSIEQDLTDTSWAN